MNENKAVEEIKPEVVWLDLNKEEMQAYLKDKFTTLGIYNSTRNDKRDIDPTQWVQVSNRYNFGNLALTDDLFNLDTDQPDDGFTSRPTHIRIAKIDELEYLVVVTKSTLVDTYDHFLTIHRLLPVQDTMYYRVVHVDVLREVIIEAFKKCLTKAYRETDPFYQVVHELNEVTEGFMTNLAFGPIGYYDDYHPILSLLRKLLGTKEAQHRVRLTKVEDVKRWLDALPIPDELKTDWEQYRPEIEAMVINHMQFFYAYPCGKMKRTCFSRRYKYQTQWNKPYPNEMIALLKYRLRLIPSHLTTMCFQLKRPELMDEWDMGRDYWSLSINIMMDVPEKLKASYLKMVEETVKETIKLPIFEVTEILEPVPDEFPF